MRFFLLFFLSLHLFGATLHLATSSNPSRLNPLLATDSASSEIASHLFNSLVKFDKDSSTIVGDLASEFYFENNTTLVFKLRDNVFWHDGEKFGAKDVLFTYKILLSKELISPYSSDFRFVKSVEVLDELSLKVHYTKPYFKALEIWMMGILPSHVLKDEKNIMNAKFNKKPIGTGPYKLTRLEYSKDIILSVNENYFEGKPDIDRIVYHIIADATTRFLMLKSKQLDVGSLDAMGYEKKLDKEFFNRFNIYEKVSRSYTYLGFNLKRKKFQDARVREAISLAISRQELVDILFFKHAKVCSGPFLPTSSAFNKDVKIPTQNLLKAKQLLKEAGYDENYPFEFEIATSNSNSIRPYAVEILQHQLKKVGIVVKLRVMEWQAFLNMVVFPREFDTILLGWGLSPTPDPYALWHSDNDKVGGFNFIGYHNKRVDALIEETQSLVDKERLALKFREIFKLIVEDNPYLFLYIPNAISVINKDIKNVTTSPSGIWHNYIRWKKEEIQ